MPGPTTAPFPTSPSAQEPLRHLAELMQLFHHRNRNQHRRSHWWRTMDIFRRHLRQLVSELTTLHSSPTTNLAKTRKPAQDAVLIARIEHRLSFWRDVLIPRCQRVFAQLVADTRFAAPALVLLAVLADVCALVGITAQLEGIAQAEMERALGAFGRRWEGTAGDLPRGGGDGAARGEDIGEVVRRPVGSVSSPLDPGVDTDGTVDAAKLSLPSIGEPTVTADDASPRRSELPKKKRKRANTEIDQLFAGLA